MSTRFQKAQPTPGDVHINRPLSDVSIAYFQGEENFVANRAGLIVPVKKQTDLIPRFAKGEIYRDSAKLRAPGAETAGGGWDMDSSLTYRANNYGWHHDITEDDRANSDDHVDQDKIATRQVTHKLLIRNERMFATNLMSSSVGWDIKMEGVATGAYVADTNVVNFDDHTSSNANPIYEVRRVCTRVQKANGGFRPKHGIMSRSVWDALALHPDFVGLISGGATAASPSLVSRQLVAAAFELEELLVMESVYDTAAEGETFAPGWIAGDNFLLYYKPPMPSKETPSALYGFAWNGKTGYSNVGTRIKRYDIPQTGSTRVEGEIAIDWKLTGADMAVLLYNLLA